MSGTRYAPYQPIIGRHTDCKTLHLVKSKIGFGRCADTHVHVHVVDNREVDPHRRIPSDTEGDYNIINAL